jgi:hypothetical protein
MDRITDRDLNRRIDTVNDLLGFDTDENLYLVEGAVKLYSAYGATGVHLNCNDVGGVTQLLSLSTKREVFHFLNGLIKGLDMARKGLVRSES